MIGSALGQRFRDRKIGLHLFQISVVHANQVGTKSYRAIKFFFVMNFDKYIHAQVFRRRGKHFGECVVDRRQDDQDAVRARSARFNNLYRVDHEVLAKEWEANSFMNEPEIVECSTKTWVVRQH